MLKSGFFLFLGLLLGRALGLLREVTLAGTLGATASTDIIVALMTLPDIFINILIGNSLAAVFMGKIKATPPANRFRFFIVLSAWVGGALSLVSLILVMNLPRLAAALLPSQASSHPFLEELSWVVWALPILSLNSVSRLFLQAEGRFSLLGLENVIFNFCLITGILSFASTANLKVITACILIGVFLRWLFQALQIAKILNRSGAGGTGFLNRADFGRYGVALTTGLLVQALPVYARSTASYFGAEGSLSIFNYAFKMIEFPMVLGVSIISSIVFPALANLSGQRENHRALFRKGQNFILSLTIPTSLLVPPFLLCLAGQSLGFQRLPSEDVSSVFVCTAIGLFFLSFRGLSDYYSVALNSLGDVRSPLVSTMIGASAGLFLIPLLASRLGLPGGFLGMNLAYGTTFVFNGLFLKLRHSVDVEDVLKDKNFAWRFILIGLSAGAGYLLTLSAKMEVVLLIWIPLILAWYLLIGRDVHKQRQSQRRGPSPQKQ